MDQAHFLPFSERDLPRLEAIRPPDWQDIVTPFRNYLAQPEHCRPIKLLIEDEFVGTGALILHADTAWLGHVIVGEEFRRQGYGKRITERLMELGKDCNKGTLYLLATELGAPVYASAGFEVDGEYVFHQLPGLQPRVEFDLEVLPIAGRHWPAVLALDEEASGERRIAIIRDHLERGWVAMEAGEVAGFYLPTWGDGLIVARTPVSGGALLRRRLETKDIVCLPKDNLHAAQLLQSLGAQPFRVIKKMRFGPKRDWRPDFIYNRIAGNLG